MAFDAKAVETMHTDIEELFAQHEIRPTANRLIMARALSEASHPLSLSDLVQKIPSIDKSGIFRTLTIFRQQHLVHVLEDGGDGVKYELCHGHSDTSGRDDDMHVHFYCEACHQTYCLEETPIPLVTTPEGFFIKSVNYMMKGICPKCKKR